MSDTISGARSSTSSVSQTSPTGNSSSPGASSTGTPTAGPARRRHKQILKCTQCRLDKQRCTPNERIWPNRCDRCVKYNHACSPGLNAREERRRQAPSSFPLTFRAPTSHDASGRKEAFSSTSNSPYGTKTTHSIRVPSPGTASSTGGSDDDTGDYGSMSGYHGHDAMQVGHSPQLVGLSLSDGHMVNEGRAVTSSMTDTRYLDYLVRLSCDNLSSPPLSNPTTQLYPFQSSPRSSEYAEYSYFPFAAGQTHPPPRPRSPTSRTLHSRFIQFWAQFNPFAIVCPHSPRFANTIQTIFTHYVPLYAEVDDMVNHALMAFSAADAGINVGVKWSSKLNITELKHAEKCQRMLGARLGRLGIGSSEERGDSDATIIESEITAVRLSILLMLCYGLFTNNASLIKLTTQLLAISKSKGSFTTSANSPGTIPIASSFTELHDGYRVRLYLDSSETAEEVGLVACHDMHVFTQIRKEYESHLAPEVLWHGLEHGDDEEGGEEDVECVVNDDTRRTTTGGNKLHSNILGVPRIQAGINSSTTLTPIETVNFSELPYTSPTVPYGINTPANHTHSHPHPLHVPLPGSHSSTSAASKFVLEGGYSRAAAPPPMYHHDGPSYPTSEGIPTHLPPQIPVTTPDSNIRLVQMHMHESLDI